MAKKRKGKNLLVHPVQSELFKANRKMKTVKVDEYLWLKFKIEVVKEKDTIENVIEKLLSVWLKSRGV